MASNGPGVGHAKIHSSPDRDWTKRLASSSVGRGQVCSVRVLGSSIKRWPNQTFGQLPSK
jgi:hypothetical protein